MAFVLTTIGEFVVGLRYTLFRFLVISQDVTSANKGLVDSYQCFMVLVLPASFLFLTTTHGFSSPPSPKRPATFLSDAERLI